MSAFISPQLKKQFRDNEHSMNFDPRLRDDLVRQINVSKFQSMDKRDLLDKVHQLARKLERKYDMDMQMENGIVETFSKQQLLEEIQSLIYLDFIHSPRRKRKSKRKSSTRKRKSKRKSSKRKRKSSKRKRKSSKRKRKSSKRKRKSSKRKRKSSKRCKSGTHRRKRRDYRRTSRCVRNRKVNKH